MKTSPWMQVAGGFSANARAAFSLVELLLVIAVIGVLTTAIIPAVTSVGRANLLTAEGNRVAGLAELTRQQAVSGNAVTALVINADPSSEGYMRSFAIWKLGEAEGGQPEWRQISRWEILRDGVIADPSSIKETGSNSALGAVLPSDAGGGKLPGAICMWVFLPSGGLLGSQAGSVALAEGLADKGEVRFSNADNRYGLVFLNATGRTKVTRN